MPASVKCVVRQGDKRQGERDEMEGCRGGLRQSETPSDCIFLYVSGVDL